MVFQEIVNSIKPEDCSLLILEHPSEQYPYSCYLDNTAVIVKSSAIEQANNYHNGNIDDYLDYVLLHEISHHLTKHKVSGVNIELLAELETRKIALERNWNHIVSIQDEVIKLTLLLCNPQPDSFGKFFMASKMKEYIQ